MVPRRKPAYRDRYAEGDSARMQALAKELVELKPDCILGQSTPVTDALMRATRTIPIVFVAVSDPIGSGFVASMARPGGNITGFTVLHASIAGKYLEMLKRWCRSSPVLPYVQSEFRARCRQVFFPSVHHVRGEAQGAAHHRGSARSSEIENAIMQLAENLEAVSFSCRIIS